MTSVAPGVWLAAGSLTVVVVASRGPWATRFGFTADGTDDELVLVIALVAAVALVVFALTRSRRLVAVLLLAGLASAMLAGRDLRDPAGPFGGPGPNIHFEWGIWAALAGSIGLVLASVVLLTKEAESASGEQGRTALLHGRRKVKSMVRAQTRVLGTFSEDAVLRDFAKRLNRPDEPGSVLLAKLVEQMHKKAALALVEQLTPVGELDYARHRIELLVSSPEIRVRLRSVEKEPFTVEWIERSIKPGDVFYDIGANVGAYSLIAAKVTGNGARIFAFEPSAATFHDLSRNILHNGCLRASCLCRLPSGRKQGCFRSS